MVMLLITRTFGSAVFGRYTIVLTFSQLIVLIFTFGFPSGVIRLLTDQSHYNEIPKTNFIKKILWITFISSITISILIYFLSEPIAVNIFKDRSLITYLKVLSFFITPLMFHEVLLNIFRGKKEYRKYNLFLFILPPLLFLIIFYMIYNYLYNEISVILSFGLSILIVFLTEIVFLKGIKNSIKLDYPTSLLFKLSLPMMISGTVLFLLSWTDIFMLGAMVSSEEVGIYNVAFKISSIGLVIILVFNVVIGPKISELYNTNEIKKLRETIIKTTQLITLTTIPIFLILIIFRKDILSFFGSDFVSGETTLVILSFSVLINAISGNVDQILNMTNHHRLMKNITVFCLAENIILNFILIPGYGINGAATASLITNISLNIISIYYIKKKLGFYTIL
ncbi:MAG: oligosaccharide flippase family protein [Flavobacteriaceae bacterium]|nr:oligosaccharide flippase family protein [Flavobacteriaceae bacterium]